MPESLVRVRPAGTLSWLGFSRAQPNRWFSRTSIVESAHWMMLHRPRELAAQTGQVQKSPSTPPALTGHAATQSVFEREARRRWLSRRNLARTARSPQSQNLIQTGESGGRYS